MKKNMLTACLGVTVLLLTGCNQSSPTQAQQPVSSVTTTSSGNSSGNTQSSTTSSNPTTSGNTSTSQGQSPSSSSTSPDNSQSTTGQTSESSSKPTSTSNGFPKIVVDGMSSFTSNSNLPPLLAPTYVPASKSGSTDYSVHTWDTGSPIPSYHVEFTLKNTTGDFSPITGFSGSKYDSAKTAADSIEAISGYGNMSVLQNGMTGTIKSGVIDLGTGITAHYYQYNTDQPSAKHLNHYGSIVWQEGRWELEVTNSEIDTLPVDTAKKVVTYLHTHFLPIPDTKGTIVVNLQPNSQPAEAQSSIAWQKGVVIYQADSYATQDILAPIEMAYSMKPYS